MFFGNILLQLNFIQTHSLEQAYFLGFGNYFLNSSRYSHGHNFYPVFYCPALLFQISTVSGFFLCVFFFFWLVAWFGFVGFSFPRTEVSLEQRQRNSCRKGKTSKKGKYF